jgi:acyl-CoA thioester hydrolase
MVSETKIDVRYPEADSMGIVHHSVYAVWYEVARMDYFAKVGFPYASMKELGINPPMVNLNVTFKAPVTYPETVTIETRCTAFGPRKLQLSYETRNAAGVLVNSAVTFHIWTGPDNKVMNLAETLPEVYNGFRLAAGADKETL